MSEQPEIDLTSCGWLPRRLIAALTGLSVGRLAAWHRAGILPATLIPGRRGIAAAYTWDDYRKVQLAEQLLAHGLSPRRLRGVMNEFCSVVDPASCTSLTVIEQRPAIQLPTGEAHTAERHPQGVNWSILDQTQLDTELIASRLQRYVPDGLDLRSVLAAWVTAEPLGRLSEFSESIEVSPTKHGGAPVIRGTRIETAFISGIKAAGMSLAEIAEEYDLRTTQVKAAVQFEARLHSDAAPIAA